MQQLYAFIACHSRLTGIPFSVQKMIPDKPE
jgi:hypothetical protein